MAYEYSKPTYMYEQIHHVATFFENYLWGFLDIQLK
jgi:hypothetical protein